MINLKKQILIIIDGPMGSGKTMVSDLLHKKLSKLAYLGTDRIKWSQSDFKRSEEDNSIALKVLYSMAETYLKNGFHVLVAQNFIDRKDRNKFISLAKKNKTKLFIYHLSAPKEILLGRIHKRGKKHERLGIPPLDQSFINNNLKLHSKNKHIKAKILDSSKNSPKEIVNIILRDISDAGKMKK